MKVDPTGERPRAPHGTTVTCSEYVMTTCDYCDCLDQQAGIICENTQFTIVDYVCQDALNEAAACYRRDWAECGHYVREGVDAVVTPEAATLPLTNAAADEQPTSAYDRFGFQDSTSARKALDRESAPKHGDLEVTSGVRVY